MSQEPEPGPENPVCSAEQINKERRRFLLGSACVLGSIGVACSLIPLASSWLPSAKTKASTGPVEVDLSAMEFGEQRVIEWQGKPVWIIKRSAAMLAELSKVDTTQLRDPLSLVAQQPDYAKNKFRSIHPEYLILIGICTHLGCSPKYKPRLHELGPEWPGGFFCPCHGSTFDLAGRVFKGVPAPINLAVPPHHFINPQTVIIGEE
ncbi:ubiquinol-cytochrome c reductase iron-sulfur subunit [Legionella sp. km772]|uniref:ubiquinol-cytochrome c reductase iron-sulfur subunit n=1 Tax=Legionella sp. km772 TaxID=2498111 RepID=UPI000F8F75DB|nr:ubiquinol-cytochrome c reductase iron-sulfur subunit [Legionella sp. km772]RUR12536.1 ubiquinol-cytochrome c reductase iron-sulfur subunit [Legionella sp. km772]